MAKTQVVGVDKFRTGLAVAMSDQRKAIGDHLLKAAEDLRDEIKSACPVKTGVLKESVEVLPRADGNGFHVQVGSATAYYAAFVEFGTSRAPAHPFVRPAVERMKKELPAEIMQVVQQTWGSSG